MEFTFLANPLNRAIFTYAPSPLKTRPEIPVIYPIGRRELFTPRKHPFENLFPTTAERDRENWFDLSKFSQEIEDDLKHHVFLYFV